MTEASKVLKNNIDKNTAERALYARYVVHLVGDIHQPLHSVALYNATYPKGDIGGNAEKVIIVNGSTSNFHSFWDAGAYILQNDSWKITRPMNIQNLTVLKDLANSQHNDFTQQTLFYLHFRNTFLYFFGLNLTHLLWPIFLLVSHLIKNKNEGIHFFSLINTFLVTSVSQIVCFCISSNFNGYQDS